MGADFTYIICPKETDKETATKRIMSLTEKQLIEIAENCGDENLIDENDKQSFSMFRDTLLVDLDCVYEYYRDTAILKLDNKTYIITGGLSWGDEPTDSYRPLWRISESFVTDTEENWNRIKG